MSLGRRAGTSSSPASAVVGVGVDMAVVVAVDVAATAAEGRFLPATLAGVELRALAPRAATAAALELCATAPPPVPRAMAASSSSRWLRNVF